MRIKSISKAMLVLVGVLFLGVSTGAYAWSLFGGGSPKLTNEKGDTIAELGVTKFMGEYKLSKEDLVGGIYIVAYDFASDDELPGSTAIIRKYFTENGYKVVSKASETKLGIRFYVNGIGCENSANSLGTAVAANAVVTQLSGAALGTGLLGTFGNSGGGSSARGAIDIHLTGDVFLNPSEGFIADGKPMHAEHSNEFHSFYSSREDYKAENILQLMVKQWIEHWMPATN
jgi:hypothetical protein